MTQEEKDLLLKDLCARTPYKTKINVDDIGLFIPRLKYIDEIICHFYECAWTKFIDEIKPYLRPMSSMTEEEEKQLQKIHQDFIADRKYNSYGCARADDGWVSIKDMDTVINFLNAHHFDYRGLIEKGLALEAPEDMYKLNKDEVI